MIALLGSALLVASDELRDQLQIGFTVAASLFIASIAVSTVAYVLSRWTLAPNLRELLALTDPTTNNESEAWVAELLVLAVARNEPQLQLKAWLVNVAIILTAATAIAIAVSAMIAL